MYETWCMSCEEKDREEWEKNREEEGKTEVGRREELPLYKYVGESSRSLYERGLEHLRDLEELKADSHMLKHYFAKHAEENVEDMKFGARIIKQASSAFNRQISESVSIQMNAKNHHILNSKSEYNRCALPRLTAKIGEVSIKSLEQEKRREKEEERELQTKIKET